MAYRRSGLFIATVCIAAFPAGGAAASEQSTLLSSRGLVEFHADRFQNALQLFDQAVAADSHDVYARYYRAVTRGRLDDLDGAIADLEAVLVAKPDLDQAALDLGVALVQKGRCRDAQPRLEQAQHSRDLDGSASLFLGIAHLRLGELALAQASLERAAARDPKQILAARYYQGIADYQAGKLFASKDRFAYVAATSPESVMGREAKSFMEKIQAAQARPGYHVYGSVGFQYDTNVVLAPSDVALKSTTGISRQSDGRGIISVGGTDVLWRNDDIKFTLGYDFFQSLHFDLTGFNLQDHGPSADVTINAGPVQFGTFARYDYYLLESDSFLQEGTLLPWLTVPEDDLGRFEFYSRIRRRDFKKIEFRARDAFNYAVGIRQVVYLGSPERYLSVGYQFDREDPVINKRLVSADEANGFAYDGNEVNVGFGMNLPASVTASGTFAYRRERYKPESALQDLGHKRRYDDELVMTLACSRPVTDYLNVTVAYLGNYNNSSNSLFDYDRSIVSVAMEVRF
jgi:tetratricopeptide (TPR) repeat protein